MFRPLALCDTPQSLFASVGETEEWEEVSRGGEGSKNAEAFRLGVRDILGCAALFQTVTGVSPAPARNFMSVIEVTA